MTKCAYCEYNDGAVYTSDPPKYRCTVTGEYHLALDDCNVEFAPVVRCKDCLYYVPEVDDPHKSTCQRLWGGMTECKADSYCSDGVRKDATNAEQFENCGTRDGGENG